MTSAENFEAWITTNALSKGIVHVTGYVRPESGSVMLTYKSHGGYIFHAYGKDWHRTKQAALERANEMRLDKIASLRKQIAKLESMAFEVTE